jgi:proteasome activator subunit 4
MLCNDSRREIAKRKARENGQERDKPDKTYISTVMLTACIALAFPYDLPDFLPALLTSLVRHRTHPAVQDVVTKAVQQFKRTHQDRWQQEFRRRFTPEQLADVQGAGAAAYFT